MPHTRFTKEFRDEAVRLALTSGRSRREIAADLGASANHADNGPTFRVRGIVIGTASAGQEAKAMVAQLAL